MEYRLTEAQAAALRQAHEGITEGCDPFAFKLHFVERLPWQFGGSYVAKVWGENEIYFLSSRWPGLKELLADHVGRRTLCHESVHQAQIGRFGSWPMFAFKYIVGWVKAGFRYRRNYLEEEAYSKEYLLLEQFDKNLRR